MYEKVRCENVEKENFLGVGEYDIPEIKPTQFVECEFIAFNYVKTCKNRAGKGVHFFLDDYQFNRLWNSPERYVKMIQGFTHVMSPDFSTYTDFPKAIQIFNHYKKHWLGAYMQMHGINVIPTISWSDKESFDWCFDGEPEGGTVAVSSIGCMKNKDSKKLFIDGYKEMISRLQPETIIFYGQIPEECMGNIVKVKAFTDKFKEAKCNGW